MSDFPIEIDATQLFFRDFLLFIQGGVPTPTFSTKTVQHISLAPGLYNFQFGSGMIADFNFTVTADGKVDYDPAFNGFLSGGGGTSNKLTVGGLPVSVDARLLTGADNAARPSGVLLANTQLSTIVAEDWIVFQTIRLLPANGYGIIVGSALVSSLAFDLNRDGKLNYNQAWDVSQGGFLKGLGSDTLTFFGYPLTVDATAVSDGLNINVENFPVSDTGKAEVVLLPAKGYALQLANAHSQISFNLELNGELTFNAPLSNSLTLEKETGGPVLRVLDAPANQLALPFVGAGNSQDPLFSLINAGTSQVICGNSKGDNARGFLGGLDPLFNRHIGVYGESDQNGVIGKTASDVDSGVFGENDGLGAGIAGFSSKGTGVSGLTDTGAAVRGESRGTGTAGLFKGLVQFEGSVQVISGDVLLLGGKVFSGGVQAEEIELLGNGLPGTTAKGLLAVGGVGVQGQGFGSGLAGKFTGDVEVTGDSRLTTGQDCAEDFEVAVAGEIEPGTVMVIKEGGSLEPSAYAYDRKVAGVVSGAGDCKPAIVLGRCKAQTNRIPVALVGKVYCKVDARFSPIEVGDLLTTSTTPGHAMKADDPLKALGSLIGKALHLLKEGLGLIPILVALQ
jgi:hypothetical protein